MALELLRYQNITYYFDPIKPLFYLFDKENVCHVLMYSVRDYCGLEYSAQWKIPGTNESDVLYAKRWVLRLAPVSVTRRER